MQGTITLPTGTSDGMHNVASDKTIIGVGGTAVLSGGGLNIGLPVDDAVTSPPANAVHNIIIRNIHFTGTTDDLIYNNYYFDNSYGIASTYDSGVLVEGNYFFSVNNPGRVEFSGDLGRIVERTGRSRGGQDLSMQGHPIRVWRGIGCPYQRVKITSVGCAAADDGVD